MSMYIYVYITGSYLLTSLLDAVFFFESYFAFVYLRLINDEFVNCNTPDGLHSYTELI